VARPGDEGNTVIGFSVVLRDVIRDASDTSDLRRMLWSDHLTGAANRTRFLQLFEREQRRWRDDRQPLSLIMLDIDHFKAINDTHGHPTGDVVLKHLTKVCSAVLRSSDLFARLGSPSATRPTRSTRCSRAGVSRRRMGLRCLSSSIDLAVEPNCRIASRSNPITVLRCWAGVTARCRWVG